jgi:hypothetical protein
MRIIIADQKCRHDGWSDDTGNIAGGQKDTARFASFIFIGYRAFQKNIQIERNESDNDSMN